MLAEQRPSQSIRQALPDGHAQRASDQRICTRIRRLNLAGAICEHLCESVVQDLIYMILLSLQTQGGTILARNGYLRK